MWLHPFPSIPAVANIRFYVLYWHRTLALAIGPTCSALVPKVPDLAASPQVRWMLRQDGRVDEVRRMCCAHYGAKYDSSTVAQPSHHPCIFRQYNTVSKPGVTRSSPGRYGCRPLRHFSEQRGVSVPYQVFIRINGSHLSLWIVDRQNSGPKHQIVGSVAVRVFYPVGALWSFTRRERGNEIVGTTHKRTTLRRESRSGLGCRVRSFHSPHPRSRSPL